MECNPEKGSTGCKIKSQIYDGSDDLDEYLTQFNLLAELNKLDFENQSFILGQ